MMVSYKERYKKEEREGVTSSGVVDELEDEEELSEDEVFDNGAGVNKPLMAPRRQKNTGDLLYTRIRKAPPPLRLLWGPLLYGIVALGTLIGLIFLVIFLVNILLEVEHGELLGQHGVKHWSDSTGPSSPPCSKITVSEVWTHTFPMLTTETAIRLVDLNKDGIEDFVLGFGTGADAFTYPRVVCDVYFGSSTSETGCGGGVLALDGRSGLEMWRIYTQHEIFALNCNVDIDRDGIADCVAGGRMAEFLALSGRDGGILWRFDDARARVETSNVYTPAFVRDLNSDGVPDLVVGHGGDPLKEPGSSEPRLIGRLLVVSTLTGHVLQWVEVPDGRESYYSPQIHTLPDGTEVVLFGTGGETHGGSLWALTLADLMAGRVERAQAIYTDPFKGIMTPPVMVDLTGDGVNDIVMAMFNSTVQAFDGLSFKHLWSHHVPSSESYSTPGVGFFNNDSIPDFIINYQTGPGFPIYYYTQTTILDGRNGRPLLDKPINMVVGTQSSPLVISIDGFGNDIFLYWVSDCHGERGQKDLEFNFVKGTSIHEQSRADLCKQRFKEKLFTRLYALTSHHLPPGVVIYDSDAVKDLEMGHPLNYTAIGQSFLRSHPEYWQNNYPSRHDYADYGPPEAQPQSDDYPYWYREDAPIRQQSTSHHHRRPPHYPPRMESTRRKQLQPRLPSDWPSSSVRHSSFGRSKRHVGPHDAGGIQRTISTGTLAPVLGSSSRDDPTNAIDIVFATFWFYPSQAQTLLPGDLACIQQLMGQEVQRFDPQNPSYNMDHDAYEQAVRKKCLMLSGRYEEEGSGPEYDPFNRPMGQMTVYRRRITCECQQKDKQPCTRVLPFNSQGWTAYLGPHGDSLYHPRPQTIPL